MAEAIRRYLKFRARRGEIFGTAMFADPAWDMLLDLYAAELEGRSVSISSACLASLCPPTTALRYICHMEDEGFVRREADSDDRRRTHLALTDKARLALSGCVGSMVASSYAFGGIVTHDAHLQDGIELRIAFDTGVRELRDGVTKALDTCIDLLDRLGATVTSN